MTGANTRTQPSAPEVWTPVGNATYEVSSHGGLRNADHTAVDPINPRNPKTCRLLETFDAIDGPTRTYVRDAVIPQMHATIEANHALGAFCEDKGLRDELNNLKEENRMLAKLLATARKRLAGNHG